MAYANGGTRGRARLPRGLVLVGNQKSGRKARYFDRAYRALAGEGLQVLDTVRLDQLDRLNEWVARPERERPMIVAAGGDGTVGTAAGYVANTDAILGILPLGTSNDIARSLDIPLRAEDAAHLLAHGTVSTIDAGQFMPSGERGRTFVHAAAMGIDVQFAKLATQSSVRKRLGPLTYVVAGLIAFRDSQPFTCELRFEGNVEPLCLLHLSIVNAPIFGGLLGLTLPGSNVDDRRLDVLAIEDMSMRALILRSALFLVNRGRRPKGMHVYHVRRLEVHATQSLQVSLDGEVVGHLPGHFELAAEALHVVTPENFNDMGDGQ